MRCSRCLEDDKRYFYKGEKGWYCRSCVKFNRFLTNQHQQQEENNYFGVDVEYQLNFQLTKAQQKCSQELCEYIKQEDILLYAICGAGKTEIILECIKQHLNQNLRVGIAIPRRQVVLELAQRLQDAMPKIKVTPVCEGYTKVTSGDLIVCTTHQLFRYYQYFDLLIIDEPDAFPYVDNKTLQGIAKVSCKGKFVYLSATPNQELMKLKTIKLFQRPHGYPLNEPQVIVLPKTILFFILGKWLKTQKRSLIFVPTIALAIKLSRIFGYPVIHSKSSNKEAIIESFRQNKTQHLFCTSILERGVTFENIDVCVFEADHKVFSEAALIQILGRIGRSAQYPTGAGLLLCKQRSEVVEKCCQSIKEINVLSVLRD